MAGNWNAAVPAGGDAVAILTAQPNPTVINAGAASAGTIDVSNGASLALQGGATLNSGRTYIGSYGGASTITVSGATWVNSDELYLSAASNPGASSTLNISNGGQVSNTNSYVGYWKPGVVTVSGAGSTWISSGNLFLAVSTGSTGDVTVSGGAMVSSSSAAIGSAGVATLLVTGAGSQFNASNQIGLQGVSGTFTVADHAQVSSQFVNIGNEGTNTLTVTGGANVAASVALYVRALNGGNATMMVENGGTVTSQGAGIGDNGGTSTATVTGPGSSWTILQDLYLGGDAANFTLPAIGILNIAGGGTVSAANVRIATDVLGNGTINIGAPSGNAAVSPGVLNTPTILFGNGTGTVNFNHTATNYVFAPLMSGNGSVNVYAGTTTLTANNTYSGPTTVNGGTLLVNGSIAPSSLTVNTGGTVGGNGIVGNTLVSGGTLAPGNSIGLLTVQGNLAFTSAAHYLVEVSPSNADRVNVTGSATLNGATVTANFAPGSYVAKQYTILNAASGVSGSFGGLANTNLPSGFVSGLSYDAGNVYLNLALFTPNMTPGLNGNQLAVANSLTSFFNATGGIPIEFGALSPLGLTQVSGELGTGTQQATFNATSQFLGLMTDPYRADIGAGGMAPAAPTGYADARAGGRRLSETERAAYATMYGKAPLAAPTPPSGWTVWAAGFGGSQKTDGNVARGSYDATSSVYGAAAGADYLLSPTTRFGFALAGGGTRFDVSGGGSGRSDLFQAGAFVRHQSGPTYLTAALAYGWQQVTTDRTVTVGAFEKLHARFDANAVSGRIEAGHRFATPWLALTPYAAGQFTTYFLPAYAEQATLGAGLFALNYAAKDVTASRSELGLRSDRSFALKDAILTLRGRVAWAHNFDNDRAIGATFQTLPGASFVVNGAAQPADVALVTGAIETNWRNGFTVAASFDGEFSNVSSSYAGKGLVRYSW